MRVTTHNAYQNVIFNLQQRQQGLQSAQEQLTTGKRVAKPSDDPVAAARAERALAAMTRADAHQRALEASRTATQLTETALGDAGELIQQAREALMATGNPSYTDGERRMPALKALWAVIGDALDEIIESTAGSDALGGLALLEAELDEEELDTRVLRRLSRSADHPSRPPSASPAVTIRPTTSAAYRIASAP